MKNNLSTILGAKLISITELGKRSKVSRNTLTKIYYQRSKSIKLETLTAICDALQITLSELIEYNPKNKGDE